MTLKQKWHSTNTHTEGAESAMHVDSSILQYEASESSVLLYVENVEMVPGTGAVQ